MNALKYNGQHITVETSKEINRVNNAPKWELCAKMTKAVVFLELKRLKGLLFARN